ncbi:MAG: ABC transporter substrate-binding protein, partial [Micromonosporaceae bacterium]
MRSAFLGGLAAIALALAGCSSGGATGDAQLDPKHPTTITVGEVPGIPAAFLAYGQKQGLFAEHGLKLNVKTAAGGAAIIPALVSGSYDIGGSNAASVLIAASKRVPVKMVAPGTFATKTADKDFSAVLARPGSGIASPKDLEGKTIAVNTLQNIGDLTIKAALEKRGVDGDSVEFTEIGFPDMLPALESGRVDAVWEIEPFVTLGRASGAKPVLWPYVETKPGMQIGSYVAGKQLLEERPEVAKAFGRGVADTARAITDDPDAFRKALPSLAKVKPELADKIVLPAWQA